MSEIKTVKEYKNTLKEIDRLTNKLSNNIMRIMFIKGIAKNLTKKSEYAQHFDELIDEKNYKYIYEKEERKEWERDLFLDRAFHYINKVPNFMSGEVEIPTYTYIYGDDGCLKYTYECDKCHSLIVVDHGDSSFDVPIVCKHCIPGYEGPHHFTEVNSQEWQMLQKWVIYNKKMNTDEGFRKWEEFKMKVDRKINYLTRWFRLAYWQAMKKKLKKNEEAKQLLIG